MIKRKKKESKNCNVKPEAIDAQVAIEYMILLGIVVAVVLVALRTTFLPQAREGVGFFFNEIVEGIYGPPVNTAKF